MLLQIQNLAHGAPHDAITRALTARDAGAKVSIDTAAGQIRVDSLLTVEQVTDALETAGHKARLVDESGSGEHVSGTSTCCGGCS